MMLPKYLKLISLLYKLYLPLSSNDDNIVGQHPPTNKVAGEEETSTNKQCCWG